MASSKIEAKNHNFEQIAVIKFCVDLRKSPTDTKQIIDTVGDGVHVFRSIVFLKVTHGISGWMGVYRWRWKTRKANRNRWCHVIDDICYAVQEKEHAPFLSFSSLGTHRALKRSNFSFSVKIVCIVDMDKSDNSKMTKIILCGKEKHHFNATSFLNFSASGHNTSPCINGYRDLVVYAITIMFTLSREIILNIMM